MVLEKCDPRVVFCQQAWTNGGRCHDSHKEASALIVAVNRRARRATSCRRRGTARSRRVGSQSSEWEGRNTEVRHVNFVDLAAQSNAVAWSWWSTCIIRFQCSSWSMWGRCCTVRPWEVRVANFAKQSWVSSRRFRAFAGVIFLCSRRI